jgi:hypothetical protein
MEVIRQILITQTYDERLKYDEYLRKVEEVKFQMAERLLQRKTGMTILEIVTCLFICAGIVRHW